MTNADDSTRVDYAQHAAANGDRHAFARVDDRQPEPVTRDEPMSASDAGGGQRSRGLVPRLRSFYAATRLKTEVDPLALVTFLGGLVPASIAFWNWVTPARLEIVPPKKVTFKAETQLIEGEAVDIVRIAGTFTFANKHPTKKVQVDEIRASMAIGDKIGQFGAGSFIHSWRDEEDSKKLRITSAGDVGTIAVAPDSVTDAKEIYFYAKPSEDKSDRYRYAFTVDDFRRRIDTDQPIFVEFYVVSAGMTYKFSFAPAAPKDISARFSSPYKWDVQVSK